MKYIQVIASVSFKNNHLLLYCLVCGHFILSFTCWFVCASVCQTAGFVFQIMQLKVALKKLSIRKLQRYSRHLSQFVFKKILSSKDLEPWITCVYILFSIHRNIYVCDLLSHCDCELPMRSHPRASNPAVLSDAACVAKLCIRCTLMSGPQHTACGICARCKLMVLF